MVAAEGVASGAVAIASFTKTAVKATYSKAKSFVSSMGGLFD